MNTIINHVNTITSSKDIDTFIDTGFRQGYTAVAEQIRNRDSAISEKSIQSLFQSFPADIQELEAWVEPYSLPSSYRFFLEYYGGMYLTTKRYSLHISGIGPMVEEWYPYIQGDEALFNPASDGVLLLGDLWSEIPIHGIYPRIYFALDLAGIIHQNAVIGIGPLDNHAPPIRDIVHHPTTYQSYWQMLAPSFEAWLALIADTHGLCGYEFRSHP